MRKFSDKIPCICLGLWTPTHPRIACFGTFLDVCSKNDWMVVFTKEFGTLDPHLPIVRDKVPKKRFFLTPSLTLIHHFHAHITTKISCYNSPLIYPMFRWTSYFSPNISDCQTLFWLSRFWAGRPKRAVILQTFSISNNLPPHQGLLALFQIFG